MLLVFGSLNVDLLFRVQALPRPGQTVLCPGYELAPGGKGANQAAAAARAGAAVRMVGQVGDDDFGRLMREVLQAAGVDVAGIGTADRPTGTAVIAIDATGENQIVVASGANLAARAGQVSPADLRTGVTLLCQNEVPSTETFTLIERARAAGARTILNLAPAGEVPPRTLDALDVLVVNEHEARVVAGAGADSPAVLARTLAARHGLTCVITLGAEGAIAVAPDGGLRVPALKVQPVDTTGAGDAFVGVLAAALDQGRSLGEALRRASVAAGLACTAVGAQTSQPDARSIEEHLGDLPEASPLP